MGERPKIWIDRDGKFFTGDHGTTPMTKGELLRFLDPRLDGPPRNIVIHPDVPPLTRRQVLLCGLASLILAFLISAACLWGPR